jgi:diguanylate cyclase (GGDEF)-like protein/PAS domain S-box-containing protein
MQILKPQLGRSAANGQPKAPVHGLDQVLAQVLEQTGEAVIVKDLNAVVTYWNREATALYGFSAHEAVGQPLRKLHAADLSDVNYARVLERVRAGLLTSSFTERRKKNGEVVQVALKTSPLLDAQAKLIGEITVARDVTALHRTEASLRGNNRALAATVRQLESFHRDGETLSRMTELLQSCTQRAEAYSIVRETSAQLFPRSSGSLFIFRESRDVLEHAASWGHGQAPEAGLAPDDCWALRLGNPHFVPRKGAIRCRHAHEQAESYVCMPVQGQGQTLGLLHMALEVNPRTMRPARPIDRRLHALTDRVGPALANLKLRDALREMALRDSLTGLYNRRYLEDALIRELHRAERGAKPVSVVMIDVDHFKQFNDNFGHDAGDFVLSALARAIAKSIRPSDIACRYGGEELAIVLPDASLECAQQRVAQLQVAIRNTTLTHLGRALPPPTASFGIAVYPKDGTRPADLLRSADQALYRAKQAGRDRVCVAGHAVQDGSVAQS